MNPTPRKIVVVEDNALNMELIADVLEAAGYEVFRARAAEEGLRMARRETPALVLMDISLPGMDGLSATMALKKDPATRDIPVVAVTAHVMPGDEQKVRAAGCAGYVTKPIDVQALAGQLKAFLAPEGA